MFRYRSFWKRNAYQGGSERNLCSQVLRGTLIGFLLVPILFTCFAGGALLFGYRFTGAFGTSMEPTLRDGDMIWVKRATIAEVRIGDVVTLSSPDSESISHRIIGMEPVSRGQYLVETKGDANLLSEYWIFGSDDTVYIVVKSIPLGGYVLYFIDRAYGGILVIFVAIVALLVLRVRRGKMKARPTRQEGRRERE